MPAPRKVAFGATGASPDDSVEPLGAERGIITNVEVDVTLERAIGVERGPAATAHVGALPRELDARPAITICVAAVEFSLGASRQLPRLGRTSERLSPRAFSRWIAGGFVARSETGSADLVSEPVAGGLPRYAERDRDPVPAPPAGSRRRDPLGH